MHPPTYVLHLNYIELDVEGQVKYSVKKQNAFILPYQLWGITSLPPKVRIM